MIWDPGTDSPEPAPWMVDLDEVYTALVTGLRDYVVKNGFKHVGLGLSGGIDSALVAALAADALGPEQVTCVVMPSPHSSGETQGDAREMAGRLGTELIEISIEDTMAAYDRLLGEDATGLAAENLQARIRGNLMMALSNSRGWLVLTTANKSETSVGYSTLYGDMAGGLAPIKDVPKTLVYELCRHRNGSSPVIPEVDHHPSPVSRTAARPDGHRFAARLRRSSTGSSGSTSRRTLARPRLSARGEDPEMVADVIAKVDRAEYKRRQSPPGLKVTTKGFGRDRRMPITNRYRPWQPVNRSPLIRLWMSERTGFTWRRGEARRLLSLDELTQVDAFGRFPDRPWSSGPSAQIRSSKSLTSPSRPRSCGPGAPPRASTSMSPARDRPEQIDRDALAHRDPVLRHYRCRGRHRADALDQAGHHAAMHDRHRLAMLVPHGQPDDGLVRVGGDPLGAEQVIERGVGKRDVGHMAGIITARNGPNK